MTEIYRNNTDSETIAELQKEIDELNKDVDSLTSTTERNLKFVVALGEITKDPTTKALIEGYIGFKFKL